MTTKKTKTGNSHTSTLTCGLCLENLFLSTDLPLFFSAYPQRTLILAVSTVASTQLILRSASESLISHHAKFTPQVLSAVLMEAPVPEHIHCLNWVNPFPLSSSLGWLKPYCLSQFPAFNVCVGFASTSPMQSIVMFSISSSSKLTKPLSPLSPPLKYLSLPFSISYTANPSLKLILTDWLHLGTKPALSCPALDCKFGGCSCSTGNKEILSWLNFEQLRFNKLFLGCYERI